MRKLNAFERLLNYCALDVRELDVQGGLMLSEIMDGNDQIFENCKQWQPTAFIRLIMFPSEEKKLLASN